MRDQANRLRDMVVRREISHMENRMDRGIKIFTVASGKGGVGKTNLVVNLAIALQKKGHRVLILDADLGLANVDVVLGMYPRVTLYDVMFRGKRLKDAILKGPGGIRIIPGGSGMLEMTKLDGDRQRELARQFTEIEDMDILLIDTGAGISMNQLSFITFSQEVILVTTPEPTAITDVYSVMKIISEVGIKRKIRLVVNRVSSAKMAELTYEKLRKTSENFLGIDLEYLGHVVDDARVSTAVMKQVPFLLQYPGCLASRCLENISERVLGQEVAGTRLKTMSEVYNRLFKIFG